jgi:GTP cyclohydrolase I
VTDGPDLPRAEPAAALLLSRLGIDITGQDTARTPHRFCAALAELTRHLRDPFDAAAVLARQFDPPSGHPQIIVLKDIRFTSLCLPSKQLVDAVGGQKRASAVTAGDKLWTLHDGRAVQTTVSAIQSRPARELVTVTTESGTFTCTPDHPFATPGGWLEAKDLSGQMVEWTAPRQLRRRRYQPTTGYDFGYTVGAVTSDGSVSARAISFVVNDFDFTKRFAAAFTRSFGVEPEIEPVSRPSGYSGLDAPGYRVRIVSSYLADLFRQYLGGDAHHMRQRFPRVVLADLETFLGFLDGYIDGDGYRPSGNNGRWSRYIVSGNEPFLRELAEVTHSRSFARHPSGTTRLGVADSWVRKHGFVPESHRTDLVESKWTRVLSVLNRAATGGRPFTVYSFTCSPYPTFLVGGHLSHNCEHHILPFTGTATVGYLPQPGARVAGVSKLARLVEGFAGRPQMQERLGQQILEALEGNLAIQGAGCVIDAAHTCLTLRGPRSASAHMITSHLTGCFLEAPVRQEFLALARE